MSTLCRLHDCHHYKLNRKGILTMLEVTEKAAEKLKEYFEEREVDSAIRIFVSQVG